MSSFYLWQILPTRVTFLHDLQLIPFLFNVKNPVELIDIGVIELCRGIYFLRRTPLFLSQSHYHIYWGNDDCRCRVSSRCSRMCLCFYYKLASILLYSFLKTAILNKEIYLTSPVPMWNVKQPWLYSEYRTDTCRMFLHLYHSVYLGYIVVGGICIIVLNPYLLNYFKSVAYLWCRSLVFNLLDSLEISYLSGVAYRCRLKISGSSWTWASAHWKGKLYFFNPFIFNFCTSFYLQHIILVQTLPYLECIR